MKRGRLVSVLALAAVLSILAAVVPAQPAWAAPALHLSPDSGAVGTRVTVTGSNFDSYAGDSLSIFFGSREILASPVTVPATGRFETQFNVPDGTPPGMTPVSVRDPRGSLLADAAFMVEAPEVWPDSNGGVVGTTVTIMARGFYVDKVVVFYYSHNAVSTKVGTAVAGPTGECSYAFVVPASPAGDHQITAENAVGQRAATMFEVLPQAAIIPTQGAAGDVIGISGSGFADGEEVAVYIKSTPVAYVNSGVDGSFQGMFKVPAFGNGSYPVRIEDESGHRVLSQFDVVAGVNLSVTEGHVGTEVTIAGGGFTPGRTLSVRYDDTEVAQAKVAEDGSFTAVFTVPESSGGEHAVTFSDGTETAEMTFTVESTPPPIPVPRSPRMGAEVHSPVKFDWDEADDPSQPVSYVLQVANDAEFTDIVLEKAGLTDTEHTPGGNQRLRTSREETEYYWRVRAVDAAGNQSGWSGAGRFRVVPSFSMPSWTVYALIGIAVVVIGLLAYRLWRRSRMSYWD